MEYFVNASSFSNSKVHVSVVQGLVSNSLKVLFFELNFLNWIKYPQIVSFRSGLDGASQVTRNDDSDIGSTLTFRGFAEDRSKKMRMFHSFKSYF